MKWPINEDLSPITSCEGQVGQATEGKNKTEVTVGSEAPGESCPLPAQKNDTTLEASEGPQEDENSCGQNGAGCQP